MTVTRKEHQVLANGQPATYTEQVAAYNKRKLLINTLVGAKQDTQLTFSNSNSNLPSEKKQSLVQMYLLKLLTLQNTLMMSRWDLQTDLLMVMNRTSEVIEMTIQKSELWIETHEYLYQHWKRAFAIEFPDECADIYRC